MILRRSTTRRVPSGPIRTRSSSQPPCSARSTSSLRTPVGEYSRENVTLSNSHSTPGAGGRRSARLIDGFPSVGGDVVESVDDLGGQAQLLDTQCTTQLGGGAGADDGGGHPGPVTHPGERDLERRP